MRRTTLCLAALAVFGLAVLRLTAQPAAEDNTDEMMEKAIKAATQRVAASVVQIETSGGTDIITTTGGRGGTQIRKGMGPTSGVVVSPDGYIITSAFNFANKPQSIIVRVPSLKEGLVAKVIATDHTRMLTLIKVDAKDLPVPEAAPKKEFQIGQTALAMGRTLDATDKQLPSVSQGIISALNRIWGKAVQTDAKVSPTNYGGPLVDLQGRVIGILVPASPEGQDDDVAAGIQWYDSGIGFAIPLEDVNAVLPKLKSGVSLKAGVLGITPKSPDLFSVEATVGTVAPNSAAEKAKLQPNDVIIEVDGKKVRNQAQVLHAVKPHYEGDTITIKVRRGKDEIDLGKITLGAAQVAQAQGFFGILPMRDDAEAGVEIRYVYPKSPADVAGLKEGDRIMQIGGTQPGAVMRAVANRNQLMDILATATVGVEVKVQVKRKGGMKVDVVQFKLGEMPEGVPEKLPEAASLKKALEKPKAPPGGPMPPPMPPKEEKKEDDKKDEKKDEKKDDKKEVEKGLIKRKNAAGDHTYWLYVPKDYDPNISYALVVWLHPAGKNKDTDVDDLTDAWKDYCEDNHIILVGPNAEADTGWQAGEADFVRECVRDATTHYTIDSRRIVAHGMGIGGQFAYYLGFSARDLFRGVATTGAALANQAKERVVAQPLSFFIVAGGKDPLAKPIAETKTKLLEQKYPVVHKEIANMGHQYLDLKTLEELVRWIDSLDRI